MANGNERVGPLAPGGHSFKGKGKGRGKGMGEAYGKPLSVGWEGRQSVKGHGMLRQARAPAIDRGYLVLDEHHGY